MRPSHLLAAALALSGAWAVASAPAASADAHEPLLVDPAGDAYEATPQYVASEWWNACSFTLGLPGDVCDNSTAPAYGAPSAGPPAPPGLDLVALRMEETPTHLVVSIDVARLDTGLADAAPRDDTNVYWGACWDAYTECIGATISRAAGRVGEEAYFYRFADEGCSDHPLCYAPLEMTIEAGTPGSIHIHVPRAVLADGGQHARLEDAVMMTGSYDSTVGMGDWGVATPLRAAGGHIMLAGVVHDTAEGGRPFDFRTPSESRWEDLTSTLRVDEDGDVENRDDLPDADVSSLAIIENGTHITLAVEMRRVNESAPVMLTAMTFALSTGPALLITVSDLEESRETSARICGDKTCSYTVQAPAVVTVQEGEPGWFNVTVRRADVGAPPAGTRVTAVYAYTWLYDSRSVAPNPAVAGGVELGRPADALAWGPLYALRMDSAEPETAATRDGAAAVVRDLAFDVNDDRPGLDPSAGMYDLVLVSVEGSSPTSTRVTLGVRDLSRITVPLGSKAVVYSTALATERGDFIVGFYRGAERGDFFCATDTLVLTDDKRDPADAAWSIIEGVLSVGGMAAGGAPGGSASSPSTLTIFVPHACFGADAPGPIAAHGLVGAVHLIPQSPAAGVPLEEIWQADEARDDSITSFSLGTTVPAPPDPPWYARPFGIDGFWDISGIMLAILLPIVGLIAVRRKRNALQRYMDQIDRALSAHAHDTKARELALVGIRRHVKDDVLRGRISEAHYLLVEARLAEHLKQARLHELTEAFGDLPHRLLNKLLEVLADGMITREEERRFGALLEDSGLTDDSKERIRRKLALWVADDASAA